MRITIRTRSILWTTRSCSRSRGASRRTFCAYGDGFSAPGNSAVAAATISYPSKKNCGSSGMENHRLTSNLSWLQNLQVGCLSKNWLSFWYNEWEFEVWGQGVLISNSHHPVLLYHALGVLTVRCVHWSISYHSFLCCALVFVSNGCSVENELFNIITLALWVFITMDGKLPNGLITY